MTVSILDGTGTVPEAVDEIAGTFFVLRASRALDEGYRFAMLYGDETESTFFMGSLTYPDDPVTGPVEIRYALAELYYATSSAFADPSSAVAPPTTPTFTAAR